MKKAPKALQGFGTNAAFKQTDRVLLLPLVLKCTWMVAIPIIYQITGCPVWLRSRGENFLLSLYSFNYTTLA
jgi:hypothetical protein